MSEQESSADPLAGATREEMFAALFANLVIQQANLALIFLGVVPHPQTGQVTRDLEAARMFIDNLEMLEAKTKGNLGPEEAQVLGQSLMRVRMAFVQVSNQPPAESAASPPPAPPAAAAPAAEAQAASPPGDAAAADAENRKKYSKKY
jgi:hypothetical protein